MAETVTPAAALPERSAIRIILGLLLAAPAAGACLVTMILPAIRLVGMSFQNITGLGEPRPVGMDNYAELGDVIGPTGALTMLALITGARLAATLILPPLIGFGLSRAQGGLRIATHALLAIPAALFAPFLALTGWYIATRPMVAPTDIRMILVGADGMTTLAAACAVGVPIYAAAMRRDAGEKISWRPLIVVWVVSVLAVIALSIQEFGIGMLTQGGPAGSTFTLMSLMYRVGLVFFKMGQGAAFGVVALGVVMLLGLAAGVILALGNVSLRMGSASNQGADAGVALRSGSVAAGVIVLLVVLGCVIAALFPYAPHLMSSLAPEASVQRLLSSGADLGVALLVTLAPQFIGVFFVQLPVTYLAAFGIGGLRPIGKWSELLLLPFSLFLFVTVLPLLMAFVADAMSLDLLNNAIVLLPRFALSVPMLFVLTFFFKGQAMKRQEEITSGTGKTSMLRTLILPSLPLAVLLAFVAALVGMQELAWPLVSMADPDVSTIPVLMMRVFGLFSATPEILGPVLVSAEAPIFILFAVVFILFQIFYVPRLALVGASSPPLPASQARAAEVKPEQKEPETA